MKNADNTGRDALNKELDALREELERLGQAWADAQEEIATLQSMYDLAIQLLVAADEDDDPLEFLDGSDWDDDDAPQ